MASDLAFGFAPDEISPWNQFREMRDCDNVCLSLPNQGNDASKYYVGLRKDLPLEIGHNAVVARVARFGEASICAKAVSTSSCFATSFIPAE